MGHSVGSRESRGPLPPYVAAILSALFVVVVLGVPGPAYAEIAGIEPSSATVVQGGVATATITLSQPLGLTCVNAPNPPSGIVVLGLPGCLLSGNLITFATTVVTPPGEYVITFEERPLGGGAVIDTVTFRLTVLSLLPPATTSTTTTTITPTTTTTLPAATSPTTTTTTTTATAPGSSSTTSLPPADVDTPPTTTTSTTIGPRGPTTSTTTTSTSPTTTVPDGDDDDDEDPRVASGGPDAETPAGTGLPPPPELMGETEAGGIRTFLTGGLPAAVTDAIVSPWHVLSAIVRAALDTAGRVVLLIAVLLGYAAYLVRRWATSLQVAE